MRRLVINLLLMFSMIFGSFRQSYSHQLKATDFDFSDESMWVYDGENDYEGSEFGNCTGAGCGEDFRYSDDRSDDFDDFYFNEEVPRETFEYEGKRNLEDLDKTTVDITLADYKYEKTSQRIEFSKINVDKRFIKKQDFEIRKGRSVSIYIEDSLGRVYSRGFSHSNDKEAPDERRVYFDSNKNKYVKSGDKKYLLPVDFVKTCVQSLNCVSYGFTYDLWYYYDVLEYFKSEEDKDWYFEQHIKLATGLQFLKIKIIEARKKVVPDTPQSLLVDLAEQIYYQNGKDFINGYLQRGMDDANVDDALSLLSSIIDLGSVFTPFGWFKDVHDYLVGKDVVTGRILTAEERIFAAIGMVMPVGGHFAVAGVKILRKYPLTGNVIGQVLNKAKDFGEGFAITRVRLGQSLDEVAVIGREMHYVYDAAERLRAGGIRVKIFEPSKAAKIDFTDFSNKFSDKRIPYNEISSTMIYKENMSWISDLMKSNITIIDVGVVNKKIEKSKFYDDEIKAIFGGVK